MNELYVCERIMAGLCTMESCSDIEAARPHKHAKDHIPFLWNCPSINRTVRCVLYNKMEFKLPEGLFVL